MDVFDRCDNGNNRIDIYIYMINEMFTTYLFLNSLRFRSFKHCNAFHVKLENSHTKLHNDLTTDLSYSNRKVLW